MRNTFAATLAALTLLSPMLASASAFEAGSFSWAGARAGVSVGYGWGSSDWNFANGGGSNTHDTDGGMLGVQAGYNIQLTSQLIAGVEASIEASNIGGSGNCSGSACKNSIAPLMDLSGKLGVDMGNSLFYGKAGAAYQSTRYRINSGTDKSGSVGVVVGAGWEYNVMGSLTTNIEYNYYDFQDSSATVGASSFKDSSTLSLVKLGFNIKFN